MVEQSDGDSPEPYLGDPSTAVQFTLTPSGGTCAVTWDGMLLNEHAAAGFSGQYYAELSFDTPAQIAQSGDAIASCSLDSSTNSSPGSINRLDCSAGGHSFLYTCSGPVTEVFLSTFVPPSCVQLDLYVIIGTPIIL